MMKRIKEIPQEAIGVIYDNCFHCQRWAPIEEGAYIAEVFSCPDCFEEAYE